jgi:DNA-binding LacI/PurR family transcriptional regulator
MERDQLHFFSARAGTFSQEGVLRMKASLLDVAKLAQVSKSTVSRAINNEGRIDGETKKRVMEAAEALHYQPNRVARSLRSQRSNVIGIIFANLFAGHFYSEIFRGIEENAFHRNYTLILGCSDGSPEKEQQLIESFAAQQVAGMILTPTGGFSMDKALLLRQMRLPVVFIDRMPVNEVGSEFDFVGTDNLTGGRLAAKYLADRGHRSVAICLGPEPDASSVQARLQGAEQVFREAGVESCFLRTRADRAASSYSFGFDALTNAVETLRQRRVTAVMAMSDTVAIGCMKAAELLGYRIGRDIALIGYNNDDICDYLYVPLTTIGQPKYAIGQQALQLLAQRIENPDSFPRREVILQPELIVRTSCGETQKE